MNRLPFIISFLFVISVIPFGYTQMEKGMEFPTEVEWELVKDEGNIQVYTRKPENAKLKELRIIAEFKINIDTLLKVLNDANQYTDWVYKCNESKVISTINKEEFYYYATTDLPFPATDRDLVVLCRQWVDNNGIVYSQSVAKPGLIPNVNGFVRIQNYESKWKITPLKNGVIHIDYKAVSDPGGSIPAWIINMAMTTGPLKTMKQLEKVVSENRYVLTK
jgi:START domain-containing protein